MNNPIKRVEDLSVSDLMMFPVWEFVDDDDRGETAVRAVAELPVHSLDERLVGTQVRLANGSRVWALIGNVSTNDPRRTQQFLTLSIFCDDRRFTVARYFDLDLEEHGPHALARFLELNVDEVFPISYDLTPFCLGDSASLKSTIETEPSEKLTRAERIALSVR